jgi:GT2 family glycosyltransferase
MNGSAKSAVFVSIVTRNEEAFLQRCLESLQAQTIGVRVGIFDNDSHDQTIDVARGFQVSTTLSKENVGYCRGHNLNLQGEDYEYALLLNADTVLESDYIERMIQVLSATERAGMACGKIFRMDGNGEKIKGPAGYLLDTTGIYFTPTQRHFDRGSNEEDLGQFDRAEYVFGVSGAILFCKRAMIEDLKVDGEFLDEEFFAYREDADLAWRAQLRGWKAIYDPSASARHFRAVLPERRRDLESLINYHSVKNRYLMRTKNMDWVVWRKCFPYLWFRDAGILAYMLIRERSSFNAISQVWRMGLKTKKKRRAIQESRTVSGKEIARWFSFRPMSLEIRLPERIRSGQDEL